MKKKIPEYRLPTDLQTKLKNKYMEVVQKEFTLILTEEQVGHLNILIDSGLVNLHAFQNTMSNVFYQRDNEKQHGELMLKLFDVKAMVGNQIARMAKEQQAKEPEVKE